MIRLRDATEGDAAALAELWAPWIRDTAITFNNQPKSPADLCQMIAARQGAGRAFLLAEQGKDQILGFATYDQFRAGPGYVHAMEHTVILSPPARGRGIGRRLMAAIEDHARAAGHRLMIAGVSGENPEGRAFHLALGYAQWGLIPGAGTKFGRAMDLWLLGKLL